MKNIIFIGLLLLICCKGKPPQSTVETTTTINKINRINRMDSTAFDLYARVPDVSFKLIPNTDTFEVIQTIEKEQPQRVQPITIKAGKKSDINLISGSGQIAAAPDKIKATGKAIISTGEGEVSSKTEQESSGFSVSLPLALGGIALLIIGFGVWWRFFR